MTNRPPDWDRGNWFHLSREHRRVALKIWRQAHTRYKPCAKCAGETRPHDFIPATESYPAMVSWASHCKCHPIKIWEDWKWELSHFIETSLGLWETEQVNEEKLQEVTAWFNESNHLLLGNLTPLEGLKQGKKKAVAAAAKVWVEKKKEQNATT